MVHSKAEVMDSRSSSKYKAVLIIVSCLLIVTACGQAQREQLGAKAAQSGPTSTASVATADSTDGDPSTTDVPDTSTTLPSETTAPTVPPSSVPLYPEPAKIPASPSVEELQARLINKNVRDAGIGSICWSRKELLLDINGSFGATGPSSEVNAQLVAKLEAVIAELGSAKGGVPPEVGDFANQMVEDARRVVEALSNAQEPSSVVVPKMWDGLFAYDKYPGRDTYLKLATSSPSCEPAES